MDLPGQSKRKKGKRGLLPGQSSGDESLGFEIKFTEKVSATVISDALIIVGDPAAEHIQIDPEGLHVNDGTTTYTDVSAGVITVGLTTQDHVRITSSGVEIKDSTTVRGRWETDGDIFIGSNLANAADTYLSIFAQAQTYNSESVSAGDMLIGDNSSSKANIFWDKSAGRLYFRGGTSAQTYINTTGAFTAGAGDVVLDADGLTIIAGSGTSSAPNQVKFTDGQTQLLTLYCTEDTGSHIEGGILLEGLDSETDPAILVLTAVNSDVSTSVNLELDTSQDRIQLTADLVAMLAVSRIRDGLKVGSVSADPDTTLHLAGTDPVLTFDEATNTPANPSSSTGCRLYHKADKLIIQFNDAGTVRYKYLDLTGTGATWTHTTSAP